jgi:methylated-DNA-protein-cysteine methyltransferase-like protein
MANRTRPATRVPAPTREEIAHDVLALASRVPAGSVTTYGSIAEALQLTPRRVARVFSDMTKEQSKVVPWYRVVNASGAVAPGNDTRVRMQIRRLQQEGVVFGRGRAIAGFREVFVPAWMLLRRRGGGQRATRSPSASKRSTARATPS